MCTQSMLYCCLARFVTAFRQWLDANGGSVGWAPGVPTALPPRETSREALLDRYNSHTKHCPSCMKVRSGPACAALRTCFGEHSMLCVMQRSPRYGRV